MTEPRVAPLLPKTGRVFVAVVIGAVVGIVALGVVVPHAAETTASAPTPRASPDATAQPTRQAPDATSGAPAPVAAPSLQPTAPLRATTEVGGAEVGAGDIGAGTVGGVAGTPGTVSPPPVTVLVDGGLPISASDLGVLVAGFPAAVPIVDDSTIVSSSVDSSGATVQATVVARTPRSSDDVVALYQTAFAALGLAGSPLQSAAGDRALAFSRDGANVTLTVGADGSGSTYSLFAVITLLP